MRTAEEVERRRDTLFVAEGAAWLAVTGVVTLITMNLRPGSTFDGRQWFAALIILFAMRVFLGHGGPRITTLGAFNVASALIIGGGAIQESLDPQNRTAPVYLTIALASATTAQIALTFAAWRRPTRRHQEAVLPSVADARWIGYIGAVSLVGLLVITTLGPADGESLILEASAFTSVVLIAAGVLLRPDAKPVSFGVLLIAAAAVVYLEYFQGGTGRLRMVALVAAVSLLFTARFPRRIFKALAIAAAPLGVAFLAQQRLTLQESLRSGASAGRTGLESMTDPILVFSQVIEAVSEDGYPLAMGVTLLTLPFAVLPDAVRPAWVPQPLGYELVALTDPAKYGSGYSVAATTYGEWWLNFGALGIVLAIPILAWFLNTIDLRWNRAFQQAHNGRLSILWLVFWVMVAGAIADLAWAGLHTFGARMLLRLPLLFAIAALAAGARALPTARHPRPLTPPPAVQRQRQPV